MAIHQKLRKWSPKGTVVKALKAVVYKTPDEIDLAAEARKAEALTLEPGVARQSILREMMQMKQYALMKRILAPQTAVTMAAAMLSHPDRGRK
jgi:hypothetical protein